MNNYHKVCRFDNGYSASIICNNESYGGKDGLFEIAILDKHGEICYNTPISNDVVGWCTFEQVANTLKAIESLPPRMN